MKLKSKKKQGFSLVEIVISFTIGIALIMGISSMVLSGMKINVDSGEKQETSQYAQQILEKFKSQDVSKVLSGSVDKGYQLNFDNITLKSTSGKDSYMIEDYDLSNLNNYNGQTIGSGYTADIFVEKNKANLGTSIKNDSSVTNNQYTLYVSGSGNTARISNEKNPSTSSKLNMNDNSEFQILVDVVAGSGKSKTIKINNDFSQTFTNDEEIRLNIDFSDYSLENQNFKFAFKVNNKASDSLNLCLQETSNLKGDESIKVETKAGKVRLYNNRSAGENTQSASELYDITVKIKKDNQVIFEKSVSRNLVIQDNTN